MPHIRTFRIFPLMAFLLLFTLTASTADFGSAMGLYQKGDYPAALQEFNILAGQGDAEAQFILGDMHANGQGVAPDRVQAYKWYAIAARNGSQGAAEARDALKSKMSANEISRAEQLAQDWRPDTATAMETPATAPPPGPAAPAESSKGGFFKNLARTVTGLAGGPAPATSTSTSVSGVRGLDAESLRAAAPDPNALQKMESYASSASAATDFAKNAKLLAQNVPYIELQQAAPSQPAAPQSFGAH